MCPWLIIVYLKRTESVRVMSKALKIAYLHYDLGLNIPTKLHETLIDSCVPVFFRRPEPSEASSYEITFGRRPVRQERETSLATRQPTKFETTLNSFGR